MKILHVNTHSVGGAFNGAYRLHKALLKKGVQSKMIVRELAGDHLFEQVYLYDDKFRNINVLNRLQTKIGYPQTSAQKRWNYTNGLLGEFEIISFPFSDYDISLSKEYQEADIVHFHWVGDYLDYKTFFEKNTKSVVWTLRDSFPFLGIFHLVNDLKRNNEKWKNLDNKMIHYKKRCIDKAKSNIEIVGLSNDIKNKSKQSLLFQNLKHHVIHNCIDLKEFEMLDKRKARSKLNIDNEKIVFCFVATSITRFNKGLNELMEAINLVPKENIEFISVGDGNFKSLHYSIRYRHLGKLKSDELKIVYSASDALIFPTKEEALGNVVLEAMACGTPVIGTPVGGLTDVIRDGFNGIFTKGVTVTDIKNAILHFIEIRKEFDRNAIRSYIEKKFSEEKIAKEYLDVYSKLLSRTSEGVVT